MKSKEILLWVVAIGALVVSLVAVIGPKGLKSDAAMMRNLTPTVVKYPSTPTTPTPIAQDVEIIVDNIVVTAQEYEACRLALAISLTNFESCIRGQRIQEDAS